MGVSTTEKSPVVLAANPLVVTSSSRVPRVGKHRHEHKHLSNTSVINPLLAHYSQSRLVRYCGKKCQRDAWPTHKTRCNDARDTINNAEDASLYAEFTHWKNEWNGALRFISLWAFDLANSPRDRLATHWYAHLNISANFVVIFYYSVTIQIEPRPDRPSRARAFTVNGFLDDELVS